MYPSSLLHSSLPVVEDDDSVRHFDQGTPDGLLNVYAGGGAAASRWSVATSANPSGSPSHPVPLPSTPSKPLPKVKSKPSLTLVDSGSPKDRSSKSFRKRILSGLKSLRSPTLSAAPSSSFTQTTFPPSPPLTPLSDPFQSDGMALTPSQQYYFSPPPTAPQSPTDSDSRFISQSAPSAQSGLFDMQEEPQQNETVHAHRIQLPYTPSMRSMPLNSSLGVDREESTISASGFTSASQYGYLNFPPPTSPSRSASLSKRSFVYETDVDGGAGTGTDGGKPSLDWKNISRSRLSFGSVASGKSTMGTTRRLGGMGKPKKLLVSGLPVTDARAEEAIRTWCESFGEVRKISHKPNGVLQVSWKKSSVADTVCRLQAQVFIEGAGSVALSWASSSKRV
ncbi:uncharacterized protein STEHIDRAFT_131009 [Stereum hirsutum FP-91666 SS1]|uniref:uncharacterized protein n=1 Tax=Stereum hirsutum (strain FP-91666) TaxID=721885 RepID=UPI000440B55D|nr:uncharacterized protein STEHIDRAFT_131009 [Stereum hirsutum FP-91666 SS1]EIM87689.1 hypothetical protein STEHIDRAFT_131009 [Stereum hirsutum FP-91666 SS1]